MTGYNSKYTKLGSGNGLGAWDNGEEQSVSQARQGPMAELGQLSNLTKQ
jgi:hypothetical protein